MQQKKKDISKNLEKTMKSRFYVPCSRAQHIHAFVPAENAFSLDNDKRQK